jgi:predicted RNA methylase
VDVADRNVFGSHEIAYECLADTERTERFQRAISATVRRGDRVLELGTGTGILSIMAAHAGASRVDAYEISHPTAEIARANIAANGFGGVVSVVEADVVATNFPDAAADPYDVLIAEMITVGLLEEQLVPAFNNVVARGALKADASCIPRGQVTRAEIVECDFSWFGYAMPTIQIEQTWQERKVRRVLLDDVLVADVDFAAAVERGTGIEPTIEEDVRGQAVADGLANAIRLTSDSVLSSEIVSGWTQCMNSPAVIPIPERAVRAGDALDGRIAYEMGGELSTVRWNWR